MTSRLAPFALALAALGCSSTSGEGYVNTAYDLSRIQNVAVVDGNNPTFKREVRQSLLDTFQFQLLKRGWGVIDRTNIEQAISELNFQNADLTSDSNRQQLGQVLNVQAITVVNIGMAGKDISLTAKMIDVQTGQIIWQGSGEGSVNSGLSTVAGALGGAVVGAAIGHNTGDHGGAGAVVGAIAGGAVGESLAPNQIENAKAVVAVVCESLPRR